MTSPCGSGSTVSGMAASSATLSGPDYFEDKRVLSRTVVHRRNNDKRRRLFLSRPGVGARRHTIRGGGGQRHWVTALREKVGEAYPLRGIALRV